MQTNEYTEQVIKGVKFSKMLPEKTALVLEGGGARTYYSAGMFDAFIEEGIMFPYIIGVSAGIANALSYVSGQKGRNRIKAEKYVPKKEYVSLRNWIIKGSAFDFKYILGEIPQKHLFWDKDIFDSTKIEFLSGTTDCDTGETVWLKKSEISDGFPVIVASCSLPLISRPVKYGDKLLFDGGLTAPIPIEKSIEDGNDFHVIIRTRNEGYIDKPYPPLKLMKLFYRKYPKLIEVALQRHNTYNRQVGICNELVENGKAVVFQPKREMDVDMMERNPQKLLRLYDDGYEDGKEATKIVGKYRGTALL